MSTDKLNLMAPGEDIQRRIKLIQLSIQKLTSKTSHYITWIGRVLRKKKEHFSDKSTLIIYPNDKKTLLIW